jgi:hypothetical protein
MLKSLILFASAITVSASGFFFYNLNTGVSQNERPTCIGIFDSKNSRAYWIVDGKSVWKPLDECAWVAQNTTDKPPSTYYFNTNSLDVSWTRPDSLSWVKMNASAEASFYINKINKATTRVRPSVLGHDDKTRGATYYVDSKGKVSWDKPVDAQWIEQFDESAKRPYYHNAILNMTVWELPEKASIAWAVWHDFTEIGNAMTPSEL